MVRRSATECQKPVEEQGQSLVECPMPQYSSWLILHFVTGLDLILKPREFPSKMN